MKNLRAIYCWVVALALWLPPVYMDFSDSHFNTGLWIDSAVLATLLFLLWFSLWPKVWQALLLSTPFALVWPLEIWVRHTQGVPVSSHLVALVWETGWDEGRNFLAVHGWSLLPIAVAWLGIFALAVYWSKLDALKFAGRFRLYILALSLLLLGWLNLPAKTSKSENSNAVEKMILDDRVAAWASQWERVYPVSLIAAVSHYRDQLRGLQSLQTSLGQRTLSASQSRKEIAPDLIILVIGESASAAHWGALGYSRDTTPQVSANKNALVFSDITALSRATRSAVPGVLARRPVLTADSRVDLDGEPSLVQIFSEVGYKTYWFSNQAPLGRHDTSIGLYARLADQVRFVNPSTYDASGAAYDEVLMPFFHSALLDSGRKFIVIHLLGSHFQYAQRYPPSFDYFTPSDQSADSTNKPDLRMRAEMANNSYDNSIRYTDHLLGQIISAAAEKSNRAVVAYFSDHGEDPAVGRCGSQSGGRLSEFVYNIPVMLWASDSMIAANNEEWRAIRENTRLPYTARAVYSTLLSLSKIDISGGIPSESFFRPQAAGTKRLVSTGGKLVDFDRARERHPCFISGE